jgi:uncharacterized membrane protein
MPQATRKEKLVRGLWGVLVVVLYLALGIFATALPTALWVVLIVMGTSAAIHGYRRGWTTSKYARKDSEIEG